MVVQEEQDVMVFVMPCMRKKEDAMIRQLEVRGIHFDHKILKIIHG